MTPDWAALLGPAQDAATRFSAAQHDPVAAQAAVLRRILTDNRDSAFGRAHRFGSISTPADYVARVPLRSYTQMEEAIGRCASGEPGVLTSTPAIAFEETGGSAGGAKLIPYTAAGLADFRAAVLPWLASLAERRPQITTGRAYVTISPATRAPRATAGGMPIGLASDAAYLGDDLAPAFAALLAVSPAVGRITDPEAWRIATLRALLAAPDLSFVSLWSPTFLLALLEGLDRIAERVLAGLDAAGRHRLTLATAAPVLDTTILWPQLDCISCWADGASAAFARQLGAMFPHVAIDAKGLLATEAAVSLPWGTAAACVPALDSGFIEFHDDDGRPRLCDALDVGATYRVVVTTASGLYRYDLGDLVTCTGWSGRLPILRFAGRAGTVSDLVGEKLTDAFVAGVLAGLPAALLAASDAPPGYVLVVGDGRGDCGEVVEARLCANPQYAHARRMGQLAPLRVVDRAKLSEGMTAAGLAAGRRMGDLKPAALLPLGKGGWLDL